MSIKKLIGGLIVGMMLAGPALAEEAQPKEQAPAKQKIALVDINNASQEELEAIPEIGTEHCHHIMMGRPYKTKQELVTKKILPKATYAKVKNKIVAKKMVAKKA